MKIDIFRFLDCLIEQNRNISQKKKINSRDLNFILCSSYIIKNFYLIYENNLLIKELYDKNIIIVNRILLRYGL